MFTGYTCSGFTAYTVYSAIGLAGTVLCAWSVVAAIVSDLHTFIVKLFAICWLLGTLFIVVGVAGGIVYALIVIHLLSEAGGLAGLEIVTGFWGTLYVVRLLVQLIFGTFIAFGDAGV